MKVALIYPPTCDPTNPYVSIPVLSAYLRAHDIEVVPIDANIEAYDRLLRKKPLETIAQRLEYRLSRFKRKALLHHTQQLAYTALWEARGYGLSVPSLIEDAVEVLRDRSAKRFYNQKEYHFAISQIEGALRVISAAFFPLKMNFASYRTPFSLLSIEEIKSDARPKCNPFHHYFMTELSDRLSAEEVNLIGISVPFLNQIQPAYSLGYILRHKFPAVHITIGGPAITQLFVRLKDHLKVRALGPFNSAVLFEGEESLLELARSVDRGEHPRGIIQGGRITNLSCLPMPDFQGLPLDKYLAPDLVLPYDFTRGCYWGKCAFCHYGLAEIGTAPYRERPINKALEHLESLSQRHNCKIFYLSQDSMSPPTAIRLAKSIHESGFSWRWASDMRPEHILTKKNCQILAKGGALSIAIGMESASSRILSLIGKGITTKEIRSAIINLAEAGIAVESMVFTEFPTETYQEAITTLQFLGELKDYISLFTCGEFALVHGARVAQHPQDYGIYKIWQVEGDEFYMNLFYEEKSAAKNQRQRELIEIAIAKLSKSWWLNRYPWAGSLSTAHSLLWYNHYSPLIFRQKSGSGAGRDMALDDLHFTRERAMINTISRESAEHESEIWNNLIMKRRSITRSEYQRLARAFPPYFKKNAGS